MQVSFIIVTFVRVTSDCTQEPSNWEVVSLSRALYWVSARLSLALPRYRFIHALSRVIEKLPTARDKFREFRLTERGGLSFARFWRWEFGEFPRLVGRYCSYLLPKLTGGTTQILIFKTLRMIGRPTLYFFLSPQINEKNFPFNPCPNLDALLMGKQAHH